MPTSEYNHPILNYSRIPFPNERALRIFRKRIDPVSDFASLRTRHLPDDISTYPVQVDRFDYSQSVEEVWHLYTQRKPHEMWAGELVKFLFAYSKPNQTPIYHDDSDAPVIHEGMQLFCLLNLAGPVGVVGMEVLRIDDEKRLIELAYIEGGIYRGVQFMEFVAQGEKTQIIHTSYYKSETLLGRLIPYTYFHQKTVREFHDSMKKLMN
jgi:hypothetical protein